jgi:uncharacterized phage protein gp47/JayE
MSFNRPSLTEIIERTMRDAASRLTVPQLRRSNAVVYTRTLSGAVHGLYGAIAYAARQILPDTADSEFLDRHAACFGLERKRATKATGSVVFTFSQAIVDVPVGTVLQASNGSLFRTTSGVEQITGSEAVQGSAGVEAVEGGAAGNQVTGDVLTLLSPVAGVESEAEIVAISGGIDEEDDESLRLRVGSRTRETPHGGSSSDYAQWCLEVPGVTRAWCYPREEGEGSVVVRFVCDGNPNSIIPDEEMLQRVARHLEETRPVTADVYVRPPVTQPVDVTISGVNPATEAVKAAIVAELTNLFTREAVPGGSVYLSHMRAAISAAAGELDHDLVLPDEDPEPETASSLLILGDVTWQ